MNELMISNISIRQDREGRYCLEDLHRAFGSDIETPEKFLALPSIKQWIQEVDARTGKAAAVKYPHVVSPSSKR